MAKISSEVILDAIEWSVTRSSGPGGQHVNKTNSAVVCKLDLYLLKIPNDQKSLLFKNLENKIIQNQFIYVRCETERDQKSNKDTALKLLSQMLEKALYVPKKRIKTKPTKGSVERRLTSKTNKSVIKKMRSEKIKY